MLFLKLLYMPFYSGHLAAVLSNVKCRVPLLDQRQVGPANTHALIRGYYLGFGDAQRVGNHGESLASTYLSTQWNQCAQNAAFGSAHP